jgi:hypothetical protein
MDEVGWDAHPKHVYYRGQHIQAFTRSALAAALNRKLTTIRMLEMEGTLCTPRLTNKRGWFLYTRDQIEDLIKLAEEEGVLDPKKRKPFSARFSVEAKQIIRRLPGEERKANG